MGAYAGGVVLSNLILDSSVKPDYTWLSFKRHGFAGENVSQIYVAHPGMTMIYISGTNVDLDVALTTDFGQWSSASAIDYGADPKCP